MKREVTKYRLFIVCVLIVLTSCKSSNQLNTVSKGAILNIQERFSSLESDLSIKEEEIAIQTDMDIKGERDLKEEEFDIQNEDLKETELDIQKESNVDEYESPIGTEEDEKCTYLFPKSWQIVVGTSWFDIGRPMVKKIGPNGEETELEVKIIEDTTKLNKIGKYIIVYEFEGDTYKMDVEIVDCIEILDTPNNPYDNLGDYKAVLPNQNNGTDKPDNPDNSGEPYDPDKPDNPNNSGGEDG